jgi:ABC-type branched-subunit amino acid transport system ATPase component
VILLDEPTAGMSKSETRRFIELIKEVTVGKTLLTVGARHGRGVRPADKIAVVVYGEVIAFDSPKPCARTSACRKPISVHTWPMPRLHTDMLNIENLHAYYGKSHVLHGVQFEGGRGRDRRLAGAATAPAAPPRQGHHGHGRIAPVPWTGKASAPLGKKPYEIAASGHRLCAREPDIFPKLTVQQNLMLGRRARAVRGAGHSTTCTRCFRA